MLSGKDLEAFDLLKSEHKTLSDRYHGNKSADNLELLNAKVQAGKDFLLQRNFDLQTSIKSQRLKAQGKVYDARAKLEAIRTLAAGGIADFDQADRLIAPGSEFMRGRGRSSLQFCYS